MELTEAAARIFRVHGLLILALLTLGMEAGMLVARVQPQMYTATAHVALVVGDPRAGLVDSSSVADTGRAIVTSRSHVQAALDSVRVHRDVLTMIQSRITVQAQGTSGVIALSVRDQNPAVAAGIANALAADLVATYKRGSGDDVQQILTGVDDQIKALDAQIADSQARYDSAVAEVAAAQQQDALFALWLSPLNVAAERENVQQEQAAMTVRDTMHQRIDQLESQRSTLLSQRGSLVAAQAFSPHPAVIDPAVPAAAADPSPAPFDLVLGAVAGLILGIALAACIETFRPTVVGRFGVARATDAPLLAAISRKPETVLAGEVLALRKGVLLAAAASDVHAIELVAAGPERDLSGLAQILEKGNELVVRPYSASGSPENGHKIGVVVVAPSILSQEGLAQISNLQAITDWPVLGVVIYPAPTAGERSLDGLRKLFGTEHRVPVDHRLPPKAGVAATPVPRGLGMSEPVAIYKPRPKSRARTVKHSSNGKSSHQESA